MSDSDHVAPAERPDYIELARSAGILEDLERGDPEALAKYLELDGSKVASWTMRDAKTGVLLAESGPRYS